MGLGPLHTISLADAREQAAECRRQRLAGIDPIDERQNRRDLAKLDAAKAMTFAECAKQYIDSHKAGWRNAKHADQWKNTLDTYAAPVIGALSVQAVDVGLVMKILDGIWKTKPETASRVRGRIEAVLDWATARGYRSGGNPARWRGHLDKLLPARSKVRKVKHHAALPYAELPGFMQALRQHDGVDARALEFAILTAARTGEVLGARWSEINFADKVWTIPAERAKAGREHRVPLSDRALAILEAMRPAHGTGQSVATLERRNAGETYVFSGAKRGKPLSGMAFLMLLRRMERDDLTAHGFRSTFRDWAAECTGFPREVAEMALAHVVSDKVEAAYRRGDLFAKRRRMMDAWGGYCSAPVAPAQGNVASLRSRG